MKKYNISGLFSNEVRKSFLIGIRPDNILLRTILVVMFEKGDTILEIEQKLDF